MRDIGAKIDHAVVVDGVNDDNIVSVRDPFDATSYTMRIEDFLSYWTWAAIWQEEPLPLEEA